MAASRRTRKNVGVIGLGIIGSRVTENLRKKGFRVLVWNRTPRPVPNFVGAPAEIAQMCDYIQIFVSDDQALLKAIEELTPALAPRHLIIAHSTVAPASMQRAAEIVERRGARFVEAPFTGSKTAAENGELVYYVGGDEAAVRDARPILEASSKEILVIGQIGQATAVKVATNIVTAASVQGAAEALALIQMVGLPLEKLVEAMRGNASNSKTLEMKLPKMIARDFEPHFSVKHMLKDIQIAIRLGLAHQLELAITAAARDRLLEQMQQGHQDEDYSAVTRKYLSPNEPPITAGAPLEVGEQQPVQASLLEIPLSSPVAEPEGPDNFVPMMPDIERKETADTGMAASPPLETVPISSTLPPPPAHQKSDIAGSEESKIAPLPGPTLEGAQIDHNLLARLFGQANPKENPPESEKK
jgi:3-hydroxyisobutyrate dehydrogenase-like beta-hydroxyacid dehydrogenase